VEKQVDAEMKKRTIVFAPHPDDETLGCGGTIAKKLSEGYDVSIVFMTDGRYPLTEIGISTGPKPSAMKEIRREDALRAMKTLGLKETNLVFLDFEDKTLAENERLVQERVVKILKDNSPAEVFFPQRNEYNVDHRITNIIIRRALETLDLHPAEYQYVIAWSFPLYLLLHTMNERIFDQLTSRFLKHNLIHVDISRFLPMKIMAIKEYKSQITLLSIGQKRPVLKRSFLERFLKSEEKFFV
jgi:LmbE family N-acetylglucosaminyl deacetylase